MTAVSLNEKELTVLLYSKTVDARGRNLAKVATAIERRQTPWLRTLDTAKWGAPSDLHLMYIGAMGYRRRAIKNGIFRNDAICSGLQRRTGAH